MKRTEKMIKGVQILITTILEGSANPERRLQHPLAPLVWQKHASSHHFLLQKASGVAKCGVCTNRRRVQAVHPETVALVDKSVGRIASSVLGRARLWFSEEDVELLPAQTWQPHHRLRIHRRCLRA